MKRRIKFIPRNPLQDIKQKRVHHPKTRKPHENALGVQKTIENNHPLKPPFSAPQKEKATRRRFREKTKKIKFIQGPSPIKLRLCTISSKEHTFTSTVKLPAACTVLPIAVWEGKQPQLASNPARCLLESSADLRPHVLFQAHEHLPAIEVLKATRQLKYAIKNQLAIQEGRRTSSPTGQACLTMRQKSLNALCASDKNGESRINFFLFVPLCGFFLVLKERLERLNRTDQTDRCPFRIHFSDNCQWQTRQNRSDHLNLRPRQAALWPRRFCMDFAHFRAF